MAAVVRVKRRIDEEPLSAFIINCKRPRLEDNNAPDSMLASKDEVSTVVKFAGTLESPDEEATLQIAKLTKEEAKELATKVHKQPNVQDRNRQQMRERAQENRFKVVNCYRAVENSEVIGDTTKQVTIVDVEKQSSGITNISASSSNQSTSLAQPSQTSCQQTVTSLDSSQTASSTSTAVDCDESNNYVYDLYLADEADQQYVDNTNLTDNYLSVRPFDDLIYEDCNNDAYNDDYDSEDSNQENYFKNEYPDTDDEDNNSFGVSDMRKAMENLDGDYDLSSDEGENCRNGFVYSIDSEAIGFEDDLDYCEVNRYGETYARYKTGQTRREAVYNDNESDYSDCHKSDDGE